MRPYRCLAFFILQVFLVGMVCAEDFSTSFTMESVSGSLSQADIEKSVGHMKVWFERANTDCHKREGSTNCTVTLMVVVSASGKTGSCQVTETTIKDAGARDLYCRIAAATSFLPASGETRFTLTVKSAPRVDAPVAPDPPSFAEQYKSDAEKKFVAPPIEPAAPAATGTYSNVDEAVRDAFNLNAPRLYAIYQHALHDSFNMQGQIKVSLNIAANGQMLDVVVLSADPSFTDEFVKKVTTLLLSMRIRGMPHAATVTHSINFFPTL